MPRHVAIRSIQQSYLRVTPACVPQLSAIPGREGKRINYASLLKGQETERSRLAKDLHDGLGGILFSVKHSLQKLKATMHFSGENKLVFERSMCMVDSSISELRRIAHNMMPMALEKFGLDEALDDYCGSLNVPGQFQVRYQSFNMKKRLEKSTEIHIYRIIQELLGNALKHARASEALVQVIRTGTRLSITVEDNGSGFNCHPIDVHKGAGLVNICSRVEYLKGKIHFESERKKGTSVFIELNLFKL